MKKVISFILCFTLTAFILVGCGGKEENVTSQPGEKNQGASKGTITVDFWSAPNQNQFDFWSKKAMEFNAAGIQYNNKTIKVEVQMTPETTSSEAAIQNAIATKMNPAASENVSLAFATVLADSDVVYEIGQETFYQDIVNNRNMSDAAGRWEIGGKQYVIPVYINPVSLQWNVKALEALGFNNPPTTIEEYKTVIKAFVDNRDKMKELGVGFTVSSDRFLNESGYQTGYDFHMMYCTYSNGENWINGKTLNLNRDAAMKAFEFWGMLGNTINIAKIEGAWIQDNIPVLMDIGKPWDAKSYMDAGKVYGEDFVYAPVPVEEKGDQAYNYADTKGIVFYKADNITEEQHKGAVEFVSWAYSAKNSSTTDLEWLEATNMTPVRGDLLNNESFKEVLNARREFLYQAGNVNYAIPLPSHLKADDVESALRIYGIIPYIAEAIKKEPLETLDPSSYVDSAIASMKEVGGLQ